MTQIRNKSHERKRVNPYKEKLDVRRYIKVTSALLTWRSQNSPEVALNIVASHLAIRDISRSSPERLPQ